MKLLSVVTTVSNHWATSSGVISVTAFLPLQCTAIARRPTSRHSNVAPFSRLGVWYWLEDGVSSCYRRVAGCFGSALRFWFYYIYSIHAPSVVRPTGIVAIPMLGNNFTRLIRTSPSDLPTNRVIKQAGHFIWTDFIERVISLLSAAL